MHSAVHVLTRLASACLSVCLSQPSVLSKLMNKASCYSAQRLSSACVKGNLDIS